MIIGIDISTIPYGTGVSEYTKQLVLNLLEVDKENTYKLFFGSLRQKLSSDLLNKIKKYKNCQIYSYPLPPKLLNILWNKLHILPIELLIGGCHVFHTSDWTQPPTKKAKTVATIHDLTPFLHPQWQDNSIIEAHTNKIKRAIQDKANFISVSKNTQDDFLNIYKKKSTLIYEAVDEKYTPTSNPNKDYYFAQGTREPRKNLKNIILAFEKLNKKYPGTKLKIAGKYGWGADIKSVKNVEILGYVTDTELLTLHQNALCLVYPSLYEGFGLPILKSLSCNVPVITSKTSSLPEVAGDAGLLVDPISFQDIYKAMEQILIDKEKYSNLQKNCLSQAKKFSWTKTAKQTLVFYKSL